ncbi:MAG TPA: 4a-hydroxytetrahydrobiopterin dehydratase [Candidatus Omnitrophota bacterium]|nr:4a-hydroxytetrahydrobiopterin dehydratase [Candidatus Omnitrophota bacterium]HRK61829.1 4a-hydroxytetrahydrobiopterin dehydratase [Candidatus Omnitrophota bacterium]
MKRLTAEEAEKKLKAVSGWSMDESGLKIEKKYRFSNFTDAVCFLNRVAEFAEELNHHPDLHLTDYKNLRVVLSTHSAGGLTQLDFKLAAQIEEVKNEV